MPNGLIYNGLECQNVLKSVKIYYNVIHSGNSTTFSVACVITFVA